MLSTQRQLWGFWGGAAIALIAAQPAWAELAQVVGVELQRGEAEARVVLYILGSDEPPEVLTRQEGNSLIADIPESQLQVEGNHRGFRTEQPIPGVAEIKLIPASDNSLRLVITGEEQLPIGQIRKRTASQVIVGFTLGASPLPPRAAVEIPDAPEAEPFLPRIPDPLPLNTAVEIPDYPELWGPTAPVQQTFQLNQAIAPQIATALAQQGATAPGHAPQPEAQTLPLQGLRITADSQANTVNLMGEASQVYAAASLIKRRDVRLPLIRVNVKILAVDLRNLGHPTIPEYCVKPTLQYIRVIDLSYADSLGCEPRDPGNFVARLQLALENEHAEILSDATMLTQTGQTTTVRFTQVALAEFAPVESELGALNAPVSHAANIKNVGLSLAIDTESETNGWLTLTASPSVVSLADFSAIGAETELQVNQLSSGQVRLRDGVSLVLTGIIQPQETFSLEENPDLFQDFEPLRSLFGRSADPHQKEKIIILVTPHFLESSDFGYRYIEE